MLVVRTHDFAPSTLEPSPAALNVQRASSEPPASPQRAPSEPPARPQRDPSKIPVGPQITPRRPSSESPRWFSGEIPKVNSCHLLGANKFQLRSFQRPIPDLLGANKFTRSFQRPIPEFTHSYRPRGTCQRFTHSRNGYPKL